MNSRDSLVRLVPPPQSAPQQPDWTAVEAQLGMSLPSDYKWLVERYGPGSFDDFLHIFQPGTPVEPIQLEHQAQRTTWMLRTLHVAGEAVPYGIAELLSFGATDNGDMCYWLRRPADDPDSWIVVVNESRGSRWSSFNHGVVKFLLYVLSGRHVVDIFPDDFPGAAPKFEPYGA